ncbi:hypothetical protein BDN72DRAFT_958505 [Pluteus cervinus]|uniref:Uncharacterized protein n=1 Tax=Pluteus cervinus TaxID=181527 RepID=A0ACD3AYR0_9AGAR|nr:hypothetical protein BDN72DRAFT_958505 [Pluteus cervinus]
MPGLWAKDDPKFSLTLRKLFDVAYPEEYLLHVTSSRKVLMTQEKVDEVVLNTFEHPSLDLNSIFQDFRLSGVLPTKDTIPIQSFLASCHRDIKRLDTKIKDTISTIAQLSCELTEASAHLVQSVSQVRLCEYLLSPPEHLPQDVLEQIFLACLATNKHPSPHPNRAPLQLAAVCHRWRTIALSMPLLWNGLYISTAGHVELAKTWVSRCYRPSLSLRLEDNDISSSDLEAVLGGLQSPALALRKIDVARLGGSRGDIMKNFIFERDHPDLDELVLRGSETALPSLPPSSSLRRFYSHVPPDSWRHSPPPSQLTVLWLTTKIHYNTLVIFLAHCPILESLYVKLSGQGFRLDPEPQVSTDLTLSRLHYFGFWDSYDGEGPQEDLLRKFNFPSLRVVEYCHSRKISTLWSGLIYALKSVHRLTLQLHREPSLGYLVHLLEHATSLRELSIHIEAPYMSDIIISLTSMVLPSIQALYLDLCAGEFIKWLDLEPQNQIIALGVAWTKSGSAGQGTHSLGELVIQHRYKGPASTEGRNGRQHGSKVKQMVQSACPTLRVRIVSVGDGFWLGHAPISFVMLPLPFNGVAVHHVLEEDDSWTERLHPVYNIV